MRLTKVLTEMGLARTGGEANRLIKQGSVSIGGCYAGCSFISTGRCDCGGWEKATQPTQDIAPRTVVKIANGFYRTIPKIDGEKGFDQLPGVCRVPEEITV